MERPSHLCLFLPARGSSRGIRKISVGFWPIRARLPARHTRMRVQQVQDGMAIQENHVYVIRPGHTLTIKNGALHLGETLERPKHGRPVDDFFKSLAEEQRERAICIILSGMGSNGTA